MATTLDALTIKHLPRREDPYYVSDDVVPGLQLRVAPSGLSWSVRYRIGSHQRRLTLGSFKVYGLADARKRAKLELRKAGNGVDPAEQKRERREADTVGEVITTFLVWAEKHKRSWKEDKRRLQKYVVPAWQHRPMKEITRGNIKAVLATVTAGIEANRVHSVISKLFSYALDEEIITAHPMVRMKRAHRETARDRVLSGDEIKLLWKACDALDVPMRSYFQLRLVTAQRGNEVASMRWDDLDLDDAKVWTIPAAISKNGLAHRVPLSPMAVQILTAAQAHEDARLAAHPHAKRNDLVLAGALGKRQQAEAATTFGIKNFRGHDLRRTAASQMASAGVPRLVISKILNHVETGVTAIYDRHGYDNEKRVALDTWSRVLTGMLEDRKVRVVPFVGKK